MSKYFALLLFFLTSFPAHSATFQVKEGVKEDLFNLIEGFSYLETQEMAQKQIEQVKNNYLFVLELIKKKQYQEANKKINSLIQQDPNQSIYYNLKAISQIINNDLLGAEQSFLKAVKLNAGNSQALTGLAKLTLYNKQFDQAKQYANKMLEINSYEVRAYQVLADVALQQQGIDAVESLLLDAHVKVKNNLKAELVILQSLRKVYVSKKQQEKLLPLATDLIKRNKQNPSAFLYLAKAQLANKDDKGAEQTLRQIITQQPEDAQHLILLGNLLSKQKGKETEILSLLDQAEHKLDNPTLVLSYKTTILIKQKQFQQAFEVAQQVDALNSTQSIGKILKGNVYVAEKKYKEALKSYQLAYQISPNTKVLDAMLKILTIQNKPKAVIALLEKEFAKHKENTQIQLKLANAYQSAGQNELSIKHYELLLAKEQDNVIALNNLAWVYSQQKHPKALKLAEQAYKKAPNSGAVVDTYGYILLKNGNKQKSLKVLKQAAELDPKLADIQLHLAEAYIANQYKSQAKEILQRLLSKEGVDKEEVRKLMGQL